MKKSLQMHAAESESSDSPVVIVDAARPDAPVLVVCEHASNQVPPSYDDLGLTREVLQSHVAWDPGALGVARVLGAKLSAPVVWGGVSRLVYDCNRPPDAKSSIPERSEIFDVPGNQNLTKSERARRVSTVYEPFRKALANEVQVRRRNLRLMVTVHSFTPVFESQKRDVEIGILHGFDARFANAMMGSIPVGTSYRVRLNEPYSAADGVAHTLDLHGTANRLANVMIEIRNDLIETQKDQISMGMLLSDWISGTLEEFLQ